MCRDRSTAKPAVLLFVVHPASGSPVGSHAPLEIVAVIPARYASTRLPGKALADIDGRPMIEHVYRRVAASPVVSRVIVATDDLRIATTVTGFGGLVRLTKATHETGTDRLAEVISKLDCDVVVNVQGDEPLIDTRAIAEVVAPFADPAISMTTLYRRVQNPAELSIPTLSRSSWIAPATPCTSRGPRFRTPGTRAAAGPRCTDISAFTPTAVAP